MRNARMHHKQPRGKVSRLRKVRRIAAHKVAAASILAVTAGPLHAGTATFTPIGKIGEFKPISAKKTKSKKTKQQLKVEQVLKGNLLDNHDKYLQARLNQKLSAMDLKPLIDGHKLSVALADVTDIENPKFASINGSDMMYAASLPKIAILFGAMESASQGKITLDESKRAQLESMIRKSSNTAASEVLSEVGMANLAKLLQSDKYKLYDKSRNGGLWVGKPYARSQAWKRDPLHNLSHGATAEQVARFYYLLESGQLVSKEHSAEMKRIMGNPALNHKFVGGLAAAGRHDAQLYRKSGSWRNYHSDSAIVEHNGRKYIAVALAEHKGGNQLLKRLIVAFDDLIMGTDTFSMADSETSVR